MPKVAIYVRLSREDRNKVSKGDDSESIINQQIMLLEYCKNKQWDVYQIYNDEDFSGSDRDRPAFNQMLQDARDKKFDIIMCKTQSRFARDMELVEKYINGLFPLWGIRFLGVVDNADTSNKANRKSRQITSMTDQWMLEDLSDNIKATLASKRRQGLWVGAFTPYGYKKDPANKNHLIIDEEAAQVVKYIFDLYLQGYGITTIARKLNDEQIPNPATYKQQHGQPFQNSHKECSEIWHTYSISRMLSNQIYIGNTVQGMAENISYKSTKKRKKPQSEWDIVENTHEPIIDDTTWQQVQNLRRSKPRSTKTGKPNIFANKIRCLKCGSSMRVFYNNHSIYYACHTAFFAKHKCTGTYVSKSVIEREVLKQIKNLYQTYVDEQRISKQLDIGNGINDKLKTLTTKLSKTQSEISKIENRFKALYYDKIDGVLSLEEFTLLSNDCKTQQDKLKVLAETYQQEIDDIKNHQLQVNDTIELVKQFKDIQTLDHITVNTLIDHIEVGGNKNNRIINIYWNL